MVIGISTGNQPASPTAAPFKPRRVSVRREVDAPIGLLEERMHRPTTCRLFLRTAARARFGEGLMDAEIRVGPLRRHYVASWVTRPGSVEWTGIASAGAVRMRRLNSQRTLVEVELVWQPNNAIDAALARADVARRRIASELERLSAVVESEAAEERLGCLVA
jgi:hypothetical protein